MTNTEIDFNTEDFTAKGAALPAGSYVVIVEEAEVKVSKASGTNYLNVKMQVVEGERKGAVVFNIFNLWNASEKAQIIARGQFSDMGRAMGIEKVKGTSEIINRKFIVKLKVEEDSGYGEQNKVTSYSKHDVSGAESSQDTPFG